MGKSRAYWTTPARRGPVYCVGCKRPIIYGERCPPCASELRRRTIRKRR